MWFQEQVWELPAIASELEIEFESKLGEGFGGEVYAITIRGAPFALKVREMETSSSNSFEREAELTRLMGEHNIGPKVLLSQSWDLVDKIGELRVGVIIMERLTPFILKESEIPMVDFKPAQDKIKEMHALGYVHGDVNPGNIMKRGESIVLIDFGYAFNVDDLRGVSLRALLYHNNAGKRAKLNAHGIAEMLQALRIHDLNVI